ncbi:MAG: hypothetical protein Q7J29_06015 [Stagnimonas sp.]|nr:hypothetical protein [Stagnimonas sp.]
MSHFDLAAYAALQNVDAVLARWLPGGRLEGNEYVALNPTRDDRNLGSFKINIKTGRWQDFATGQKGFDLVDLVAMIEGCGHREAVAQLVAHVLHVRPAGLKR